MRTRIAAAYAVVAITGLTLPIGLGAADPPTPPQSKPTDVSAPMLDGVARPWREANISSPFEDRVMRISVREGQRVEAGEPLVILDDRLARAALESARAAADRRGDVKLAQAELKLARFRLERLSEGRRGGAASNHEMQVAEAEVSQAEGRLLIAQRLQEQARRQLEQAGVELERRTLRAPFAGEIVSIHAEEGESVRIGDTILELAARQRLRAELHLPAEMGSAFAPGELVNLRASSPIDRSLESEIVFLSPMIEPATRTVRVVVEIDNRSLKLPAGFTVSLGPEALARVTEAPD